MAAGYENTPRHNFICIQADKFCLSHESMIYLYVYKILMVNTVNSAFML